MRLKLLAIAYFFICANCIAQQYPFVYYTPKDGLINSRVRSIKQDSRGLMYFITRGGLSVYDGARFVNYSQENGLPNDLVNDVIEMAPDSFLIATNIAVLNTLVKGKIGVYKTADKFCPVINRFYKNKNGDLYFAADQGLFVLSGNRFIKIPLYDKNGNEIGVNLDRVIEWNDYLFLTTWDPEVKEKLIVYDKAKKKTIAIENNRSVYSLAVNTQRHLLVTTDDGIWEIDAEALKKGTINFLSLTTKKPDISKLKHTLIFFDTHGDEFLYNRNGFYKIISGGELQSFNSVQGLKVTNLTDLFIDKEGNTWIATDGNGIAKLPNSGVELISKLNNVPASITAISQQADTLWAYNNVDNSIYRICENSTSIFPLPNPKSDIINIYIRKEKLYLVQQNRILCVNNKNNPEFYKSPETIFADQNIQFGNGVLDKYGNIIIELTNDGKSFYTVVIGGKTILFSYRNKTIADQVAIDSLGRFWLITRKDQLLLFTLHPDDPSNYLQLQKDFSKNLPNLGPRSIMVDKNNYVWIGTRYNGIYFLRFKETVLDSLIHFTTKDGLTDNFVYTLACDTNGIVWAGTQTGLDKIFFKNGRYIIENVSRGNELYQSINKIAITENNTVWALPNEGPILKVSPNPSIPVSAKPQLIFTEMKVNDSVYRKSENRFSNNQNNFSFSVAAPSFINEKLIRYSYLLEGSGNAKWSEASNQSSFIFINLSPAYYTLKVKCDFPGEIYDSQMISYSFIIDPPWWQTWWFRIITGIFLIGVLFLAIRSYYKRKLEKTKAVLEKQQAVEKERTRIAIDMHDDLGAGLSRIKFLSETIGIKKQREEPIEEDINKIRNYSHEMIDKMGEIVWALNEKNDSLSDLLSYTRSYAVEYLSQSGIRCEVEAPDTFPTDFVSGEFRRNIYLVVKEALHNIVKHALANRVTLKIITNHHQLEIYIADDGIGFDRNNIRPYSNGLTNMEIRITEIGGSLIINSDKGTMIHITAPLKT